MPFILALKIGKHALNHQVSPNIDNWFKPSVFYGTGFGFPVEWTNRAVEIANQVEDYGIINKEFIVPTYKELGKEYTDFEEVHKKLEMEAWKGLYQRGKADQQEYIDRLQHELNVMKEKKFSSYFLLIAEIVGWMKLQNILQPIGRGCLTGDIKVLTSNRGYISLKHVNVRDKVFTHDGKFKCINKIFKYNVNEEILKIKTQYAFENLELTKDHKVYAYKRKYESYRNKNIKVSLRNELENVEPKWIEAKHLKVGDYIYTPFRHGMCVRPLTTLVGEVVELESYFFLIFMFFS